MYIYPVFGLFRLESLPLLVVEPHENKNIGRSLSLDSHNMARNMFSVLLKKKKQFSHGGVTILAAIESQQHHL